MGGETVGDRFDYIIVGGGSAGAAVASRLSEDAETSVLLLEAGKTHKHWTVRIPFATIAGLVLKDRNWGFETVPQKALNGRQGYQPRGKMLGGSSGSNAMIYIRGNRYDYDNWAEMGAEGWDYESVLPYFKKSEHREAGANAFHGEGGPLNVAAIRSPSEVNSVLLEAGEQLQLPHNDDFNGADQEGLGLYEVTQKDGERWNTARAYLDDHDDRANLTIVKEAMVEKIIIEDGRATGVAYKIGRKHHTAQCLREVVLCAGAFGSPQLLLLSGIGAEDKLRPHGIEQVQDVAGVGENLHDHIDIIYGYKSDLPDLMSTSLGGVWRLIKSMFEFRKHRTGMMTSNFAESGGFLYTDRNEPAPDVQLHMVRGIVDDHGRKMHLGGGYSCHICVLRPKSRGTVQLASANPNDAPLIDPAFLEDERDLDALLRGAKLLQRVLRAPAFDRIRGKPLYASDSDDEVEMIEDIRNRADTVYHPVGTCKMGDLTSDSMAVVDSRLRVRGLNGLRVADASIMPQIVSGNTNAPSIMVGEKAADMIKEDWQAVETDRSLAAE